MSSTKNNFSGFYNKLLPYLGGGDSGSSGEYKIYSTEEQVIGEWIDGKPVYAKLFTQAEYNEFVGSEVTRLTGTPFCSSYYSGWPASYAFDDDESTAWIPNWAPWGGHADYSFIGLTLSQPYYFVRATILIGAFKDLSYSTNVCEIQGKTSDWGDWFPITQQYTMSTSDPIELTTLYPETSFIGLRFYATPTLLYGTSLGQSTSLTEVKFYGATTPPMVTILKHEQIKNYIYAEYTK